MDDLAELIERIGDESNPPTDEELAEARAAAVEALDAAVGENVDTPDLEAGRAARAVIDALDAESARRAEAAAADAAEAAELRDGVVVAEDEDDDEDGDGEAEVVEAEAEDTREPVAAAIDMRAFGRARARVQANAVPVAPTTDVRIRAIGPAAGETVGPTTTLSDAADIFGRHYSAVRNPGARNTLVRLEFDYPEMRQLGTNVGENNRALSTVVDPAAVAAAGGICDPIPADFSHPICSDRGRPIRDALPRFQSTLGSRGSVRFAPARSIGLLTDAITVWDIATDEDPGEDTKACLVVDCEDELEAKVDAVVACVQIGNFQARFNPEDWRSILDLLGVEHDRVGDTQLYAQMAGDATAVTYGAGNGTIYSVLSGIDKAVAGLRSRHRYRGQIRVIGPDWVHQALRAAIASQRLGSSPAEALTVADQIISGFFSARGVTPVWSLDLDLFGTQNAGALLDFPGSDVDLLIYPEGTYYFLDGGTLDLGTEITDSTLNATNDRQAFWETFEKAVFRGCEALELTVPVAELCVCSDVLEVEAG